METDETLCIISSKHSLLAWYMFFAQEQKSFVMSFFGNKGWWRIYGLGRVFYSCKRSKLILFIFLYQNWCYFMSLRIKWLVTICYFPLTEKNPGKQIKLYPQLTRAPARSSMVMTPTCTFLRTLSTCSISGRYFDCYCCYLSVIVIQPIIARCFLPHPQLCQSNIQKLYLVFKT